MVLNVRQKQIDGLVRLLHFNTAPIAGKAAAGSGEDDAYKVLILDRWTKDLVAPLLRVNDLRRHGVTLHLLLETERQAIADVPAIYLVRSTEDNVQQIIADVSQGLYNSAHVNFVTWVPPPLLERLASGTVAANCSQRVAAVYDQYLAFIALEAGLFSLGLPDVYLQLNDPGAKDTQIEAAVGQVVDGLFSVLATLGIVPIIRCPRGGAAEHVGQQLEAKLREHLKTRNNLFTEGTPALAAALSRPLLCLFDRNFELSVVLQHTWTYKPLCQDVLGMQLNRISLTDAPPPGAPPSKQPASKKNFEVGEGDFFWELNGRNQFPKVAEDVDVQLQKYKAAVEEINRKTGSNMDPNADPNDYMQANTRGLMAAVSSLPELTERKRCIDKHTNLATRLLGEIKNRGLDQFYHTEEDLLSGQADLPAIEKLLQSGKGTPEDRLRLVLVYLLTCETQPSDADYSRLESALQPSGEDLAALAYVRRMRRLNLTGKAAGSVPSASAESGQSSGLVNSLHHGLASQSHLLNWADKTFGQGLTSLTKGVKNLLAGEQQAAVTVAVDGLMDAKPSPELDNFAIFDPKTAPGKAPKAAGPFKEALVFMIGGGNYLEYESLVTWASRATPPKSIIYGATELLSAHSFIQQLAELGRRSGAV